MTNDFLNRLEVMGEINDADVDLVEAALLISAIQGDVKSIERYQNHFKKLCEEVKVRYDALLNEGAEDSAATQIVALKHIILDKHDYRGDTETYEDLQNVDLIRVVERRKGMPVSIALIYIHVGLAQGWNIEALSFPAHVVCRIEKDGERILLDPFNDCRILEAHDLRLMIKQLIGEHAELSVGYYEPALRREIIIRMQNNIKLRQIEAEDYFGAIKTINIMQLLDPKEYRLLFDAGVLYARTHQVKAAIDSLEDYIDLVPNFDDQQEAILLLNEIKSSLN